MERHEQAGSLAESQPVSDRQANGNSRRDQPNVLERLGVFLLLLHRGRAARYWEIDALRGVAIVMMVTYHLAYDLAFLGYYQANVLTGPWRVFARATAGLFILLVGVSLTLGYTRASDQERGWNFYKKYLVRGLKLVGWGLVITVVTWMYMGRPVVIFGILHLIGVATLLAYPFLSLRWANLPLGSAMIAFGLYLNRLPISHPFLLLLGLRPRTLFQVDYFPLLPWFGVVLLGVFIGQRLYPDGSRRFNLPSLSKWSAIKVPTWLGLHSLAVYLIHQPILLAIITLASALAFGNFRS